MNRWATLAVSVVGATLFEPVALVAQSTAPPVFKAHVLTRAEFDALLRSPERLLIVDVRRPDEIAAIGGFVAYLNVQPADVETSAALIPRERVIVTVSNHAARAGRVADALVARGFNVAGALGAQDYEQQGGTLTRIAPRAAQATGTSAAH